MRRRRTPPRSRSRCCTWRERPLAASPTWGCGWLRIGYVQSNYNADNSLIGGATVDYGPFGFLEKRHEAGWSMWIGGGQHFSFGNQPKAAGVNLRMLLRSLEPLLDDEGIATLRRIASSYATVSEAALAAMWASLAGLPSAATRGTARARLPPTMWQGSRRRR